MGTTTYTGPVSGWSAAINSAAFYACSTCGACVMEQGTSTEQRDQHAAWHDGGGES